MSPSQLAVEGQTYQGVHKGSAGYKLLASMGWKEGQGLGANGQGIVEHIKVKKKADSLGVGTEKAMKKNEDWLLNMSVFDKMLAGLKEVKANPEKSSEKSKDENTAEQVESNKSKKKRKASKSDSDKLSSKSLDKKRKKKRKEECEAEQEVAEEETSSQPVATKKAVSHVGRFRRREAAKSVKNYSSVDLAAILGTSSQAEQTCATKKDENSPEVEEPSEAEEDEIEPEDETSKWWAGRFMRAGTLQKPKKTGSNGAVFGQQKKAAIKIHGFSEEDQTNLWTRAQEGASKGRKGLGDAAVKKIGGEKVGQGKKTVFSEEEEGESESAADCDENSMSENKQKQSPSNQKTNGSKGEQSLVGKDSGGLASRSSKEKKKKSSKIKSNKSLSSKEEPRAAEKMADKKMLKIALKKLKANGGELKFRKLCKLIIADLDSGNSFDKEACQEQLKVILGNSRKFEFDGKVVKRSG